MTAGVERAVRKAVAEPGPEASSQAETPARAREASLAPAPELPSERSGLPATQSYRDRARKRAEALGAKVTGALSGPSLWHSPAKSMEEARTRHHAAVTHWEAALIRGPRLAWGYGVHLPAKGVGHLLDWLTSSPVITVTALAIWVACHYWLLHWLPWF